MKRLRSVWQRALAQVHRAQPHSRLAVISDGAGWVLDYEAEQLVRTIARAGGTAMMATSPWPNQPAFFTSRLAALQSIDRWHRMGVPVCLPYFHGYPGEGDATFDATYEQFRRSHERISRVQVTHPRMRAILLDAGIAPEKLRTILIGVDSAAFAVPADDERRSARAQWGVPSTAVVIGSFQKDGDGWGGGDAAKLVKGPDVLLAVLTLLKQSIPDLFVLLSGPARGFVRRGLDAAGIPHVHHMAAHHRDVPALYHALDAYVVTSRQEGGPKAILESMASGVPIVSTRVGQAPELIRHSENGWLADVGDVEGLAHFARQSLDPAWRARALPLARATAEQHDYRQQLPQWVDFFDGLLQFKAGLVNARH